MLKKLYFKQNLSQVLLSTDKYAFLSCSNLDSNNFSLFKLFCRFSQIKCFFLPKRLKFCSTADYLLVLSTESQVKLLEKFLLQNPCFFILGFCMNKTFFYSSDLKLNNLSLLEAFNVIVPFEKLNGVLKYSVLSSLRKLIFILNKHGNS